VLRAAGVDADAQAADAQLLREFQVGIAIADHGAALAIDRLRSQVLGDQAGARLAARIARASRCGQMNTCVELDALRGEAGAAGMPAPARSALTRIAALPSPS
jgi:hypothetical protein